MVENIPLITVKILKTADVKSALGRNSEKTYSPLKSYNNLYLK